MSTPDNHGKKAPQFAAFKPLTTVQNTNDCCCDGACSSTPTLSENVSGTRYSWKVSGMDCAACARKVENAVRQLARRESGTGVVRHRKTGGGCRQ